MTARHPACLPREARKHAPWRWISRQVHPGGKRNVRACERQYLSNCRVRWVRARRSCHGPACDQKGRKGPQEGDCGRDATGLVERRVIRHLLLSPALWPLLLAALLVRGAVPVGWMPEAPGGQMESITVHVCNTGQVMTIPIEREGDRPSAPDAQPDDPCPFATMAGAAPLPATTAAPIASAVLAQQRHAAFRQLALKRAKRLLLPSRAPPVPS